MPRLQDTLQLGDAVEHRGIVITPVFPRHQPSADYLTLDQAIPLGFHVSEINASGSVPELLATNPLEANVLLYDGEELIGAKQNRILNLTVLVPMQSETRIPVSCVEEGRWSSQSAAFAPARHAAYPELRRRKAQTLSAQPLALGIAQADIWQETRSKIERLSTPAPTGAQADIFKHRERTLARLRKHFPLAPGQGGAIFALGEAFCLDYLSRPDAFARLYPKLLDGYLLDASEQLDGQPAAFAVDGLLEQLDSAPRSRRESVALGNDLRLHTTGLLASGLELDDELIQLSAFSTTTDPDRSASRISRPSRRR
jgi:hypothetical protein